MSEVSDVLALCSATFPVEVDSADSDKCEMSVARGLRALTINPALEPVKIPKSIRRERRRHLVAQLVSKGFQGEVVIDADEETALSHAEAEYTGGPCFVGDGSRRRMVLCANGAVIGGKLGCGGAGVAYRVGNGKRKSWVMRQFHSGRNLTNEIAEVVAISKALEVARDERVKLEVIRPATVVVYSESASALVKMLDSKVTTKPQGSQTGIAAASTLQQLGIRVELRWVPRGKRVQGCMFAHQASKSARSLNGKGKVDSLGMREIWKDRKTKNRTTRRILCWPEAKI